MNNWINEIDNVKDSIKKEDIEGLKKDIIKLIEYIKYIQSSTNKQNEKQIRQRAETDLITVMNLIEEPTSGDIGVYEALLYIKSNKKIFLEKLRTFDKSLLKKQITISYGIDINTNLNNLIYQVISQMLEKTSFAQYKDLYLKNQLHQNIEEQFNRNVLNQIERHLDTCTDKIKLMYVSRIRTVILFLLLYGQLDEDIIQNNTRWDRLDLSAMKIVFERGQNNVAIEDMLDERYLKDLPVVELVTISTFFVNRFVKVVKGYMNALYVLNKKELIPKIVKGEDVISQFERNAKGEEETNNELKKLLIQKETLTLISYEKIYEIQNKSIKRDGLINFSYEDSKIQGIDISELVKKYESDYNQYYKFQLYFLENDFEKDINTVMFRNIIEREIYLKKQQMTVSIILFFINNGECSNWGYIPEYDNEGRNSIQRGKKYVLLGFNVQGYNSPLRVHIEREKLTEIIKLNTNSSKIRLYVGNENLYVGKEYMTSIVFHKMSLQKINYLKSLIKKKKIKPEDPRFKYIETIIWLYYKERFPKDIEGFYSARQEADLETGEIISKELKKIQEGNDDRY